MGGSGRAQEQHGRVAPVASAATADAYSRPVAGIHDRELTGIG